MSNLRALTLKKRRLSEVVYTVSPMKTGVMGGLFKDFGATMTKKLVGWTDVGEAGMSYP